MHDFAPAPVPVRASARLRFESVDVLRGLAIVIMALDHVREYLGLVRGMDATNMPPAYFFTRLITHLCAPTFCFLAGTSAFLVMSSGRRTVSQLSRFLLARGAWLLVAEVTIIGFGWFFNLTYPLSFGFGLQVIWVLGASMIALAGLVRLPLGVIAAIGIAMVAGHNLFDGIQPSDLGPWANVWYVLHVQGRFQLGPIYVFIVYPLIPWVGVMALGYVFGTLLTQPDAARRRRTLIALGLTLTLAFVVVRAINGYGDPVRWTTHETMLATVIAFLNVSKYPPSLLFLLMTLGPALLLLAWFERWTGVVGQFFATIGRVPFFFYVLHIYLIHALTVACGVLQGFPASSMMDFAFLLPPAFGYSLPAVYAIWIGVVLALYPACRWFAAVKARHRHPVLSYL